ncbi:hypothetical protein ON010_g16461 [Phytophthora cinnamomi]|nr:hypothetical protein ON010_g16461 [Phytophthora cinnamomi]
MRSRVIDRPSLPAGLLRSTMDLEEPGRGPVQADSTEFRACTRRRPSEAKQVDRGARQRRSHGHDARDKVSTHYYFYDGKVLSPGGDNFAPRSYDSTTVYVTLIDDSGDGLIKIVELDHFDFTQTELGSLYQKLVDC